MLVLSSFMFVEVMLGCVVRFIECCMSWMNVGEEWWFEWNWLR